jgi:hypothetical protein
MLRALGKLPVSRAAISNTAIDRLLNVTVNVMICGCQSQWGRLECCCSPCDSVNIPFGWWQWLIIDIAGFGERRTDG